MSSTKKEDGSTKSFVEYKAEVNTSDTRVEQIANAGASAVGGSLLDLDKNQKRWMVTGICLFKVVTPQLRKYVEQHLMTTYDNFKKSDNIDHQMFPKQLKNDGKYKLNYAAINKNQTMHGHSVRLYDYKVTSPVDMAKLYLQTHMAKFSAFDESCDPSAVLGILCAASCFSSTIQTNAQDVRSKVRNEWAHCNFADWDETKFVLAFQIMEALVKSLALPPNIVDQMNDWKDKGVQLCMGSPVDKDLLQVLYQEVSVLGSYSLDIQEDTKNQLQEICKQIDSALQEFERRLVATEEEQKVMGAHIGRVKEDVKNSSSLLATLVNEHNTLQEEHTTTKHRLGCTQEDVQQLQEVHSSVSGKIQSLEAKVQSLAEKSKYTNFSTISQAPNRNEYFSGRKNELYRLEEAFGISESSLASNKVLGISGLGGCGKTTLAVEYSWRCCSYYKGGIFWISAESETFFRNTITELAFALDTFQSDFDQCLRATLVFLSRLQFPFLLVVDNADELELSNNVLKLLRGHWMRKSKGHILVTTRRKEEELLREVTNIKPADCITLGCYTQEEAITFMQKRTNKTHTASVQESSLGNEDFNAVAELIDELGCHPLALEQAGSHIRGLKCTYSLYLREFKKLKMKLIQQRKAEAPTEETSESKERLAVHTTWLMNFEYASQLAKERGLEELTSIVIDVSAYLSSDEIPCGIISQAYSMTEPREARFEVTQVVVGEILDILTKFSLFQSTSRDSLSVHRLVQQVIQSRCSEERRADVLQYGMRMLDFAFRNTKSPAAVIAEASDRSNPNDTYLQEKCSLLTWARLASNAVTMKSHMIDYVKEHTQAGSRLLYAEETANVLWETTIYLSMSNQQPQAFESQRLMLQILAGIGNKERLTNQLLSIPLTEHQRRVLRLSTRPKHDENENPTTPREENKLVVVDDMRLKGNEAYEAKEYEEAVSIYTEAIKVARVHVCRPEDLAKLYSNRSQCYRKLDNPTDALHDAEECIKLDPNSWKSYLRRAWAMKRLFDEGKEEYKLAYVASATMAVNLNSNAMEEAKRMFGPDIHATVVSTQEQWIMVADKILRPPRAHRQRKLIVILKSGKYVFHSGREKLKKDEMLPSVCECAIFIGVGDVQINNVHVLIGEAKNYHFENIVFDDPVIVASKSFVSCMGCTFQNGATKTFSKCLTTPCYGCRICCARSCVPKGDVPGGNGNLQAITRSKLFVTRCILCDSAGGVLATDKGTSAVIKHCKIHNHCQASVEVRYGASLVAEENDLFNSKYAEGVCIGPKAGPSRVANNRIYGNESWGIVVARGSKDVTIDDNEVYQNKKDGIMLKESSSMVARRNEIFENGFWGINLDDSSSDDISENIIHHNNSGGIRVARTAKVVLRRNKVTDHDGPGILQGPITMEDLSAPSQSLVHTPAEMIENIEMRNKEGRQHPKERNVSIGSRCASCHKMQSDKNYCTLCYKVFYCNKDCQKQHWKRHKPICKALKGRFSEIIAVPPTGLPTRREFHPKLKGIREGPKPNRNSTKRFIVKIQTQEDFPTIPYHALTLYDQSTDVNVLTFQSETIHNIIVQCGVLGCSKSTGKKIFCYASFEDEGNKLRIYLDELAPFQEW